MTELTRRTLLTGTAAATAVGGCPADHKTPGARGGAPRRHAGPGLVPLQSR